MLQVPLFILLLNGLRTLFFGLFTRFWAFILFALPWIIEKVIVLLGVGLVSYTGFDFVFSQIESFITTRYDNLGTDLLPFLNLLGLDVGINIVMSSMAAVLAYKATVGTRKLLVKKSSVLEA